MLEGRGVTVGFGVAVGPGPGVGVAVGRGRCARRGDTVLMSTAKAIVVIRVALVAFMVISYSRSASFRKVFFGGPKKSFSTHN